MIYRGETLQRKTQKEDFLSNRWCEVNHLCVSKKCVTPDTFPLLQSIPSAGAFSQSCSSGLFEVTLSAPNPCSHALNSCWLQTKPNSFRQSYCNMVRTLFRKKQCPQGHLSPAKLAKDSQSRPGSADQVHQSLEKG